MGQESPDPASDQPETGATQTGTEFFEMAITNAFDIHPSSEDPDIEFLRRMQRGGTVIGIEATFEALRQMGIIGDSFDRPAFSKTLSEIWAAKHERYVSFVQPAESNS